MTKIEMITDLILMGPMSRQLVSEWGWEAHETLMGTLMSSPYRHDDVVHFYIRAMPDHMFFELVREGD